MSDSVPCTVEALWKDLEPHFEWAEGFSLIILFAGHPGPVAELRERLARALENHGKSLKVLDPSSADELTKLLPSVIASPVPDCGAVWVSLLRQGGLPEWTTAVRWLLQRLNERRSLLERDVRVPLVLVLPLELRSVVYVLAPDLWTIRTLAKEAPKPEPPKNMHYSPRPPLLRVSGPPRGIELEWARLSTGNQRSISVADGLAASESALDRDDVVSARRVARQTLAVALARLGVEIDDVDHFDLGSALARASVPTPRHQHELAAVLDALGSVESRAGDQVAAGTYYRWALDLCRARNSAEANDGRAAQDFVIALHNLAVVEFRSRDFAAARALLDEAIEATERRLNAGSRDADMRHELVLSLLQRAEVELDDDELHEARGDLQRVISSCEPWVAEDPYDVRPKRSLAYACESLGLLEERAGNLDTARRLLNHAASLWGELAAARQCSWLQVIDVWHALGNLEFQAKSGLASQYYFFVDATERAHPEDLVGPRLGVVGIRRISRP